MILESESGFVGVFDSGVGGLTVVRRLISSLPHLPVVFVADQSHVPYGGRPLSEVRGFAAAISRSLIDSGATSIVMACNISTATALSDVQESWPDHLVMGVIGPGALVAARESRSKSIGVLATAGTVSTGAYTAALTAISSQLSVTEVACPEFVPLIEAELTESAEAFRAAEAYIAPILLSGADVVILGCTHYPFLLPCLRRVAPHITFIDPAVQTICELSDKLIVDEIKSETSNRRILYTTGDLESFREQVRFFLPEITTSAVIRRACWEAGELTLANA